MTQYLVKWEIDIEADNPEEAARKALEIQRDRNSRALVFDVIHEANDYKWMIDLEMATTVKL